MTALLAHALGAGLRRGRAAGGARGLAAQAAAMMAAVIGLHSLVEYPLWYAYFLLPTAFAWGLAQGTGPEPGHAPRPSAAGALAGAVLVLAAGLAAMDYLRVSAIYAPGERATGEVSVLAEGLGLGASTILGAPPTYQFNGVTVGPSGAIYVTGDVTNALYRIWPR